MLISFVLVILMVESDIVNVAFLRLCWMFENNLEESDVVPLISIVVESLSAICIWDLWNMSFSRMVYCICTPCVFRILIVPF